MENAKGFAMEYIRRKYTLPEDIGIAGLNRAEEGYVDPDGPVQPVDTIEDGVGISFYLQNPDMIAVRKLIA